MNRYIKTTLVAASFVIALPALAMAAAAPNFGGSWVRDAAKSTPVGFPTYWLTRAAPAGGGGNNEFLLEVRHEANRLSFSDPARPVRTMELDGRPYTLPMPNGLQPATVTATLQGDAVVVTRNEPYAGMPGNVAANIKETWSLSPDGKVLTIDTVRATPALTQAYHEVFSRR